MFNLTSFLLFQFYTKIRDGIKLKNTFSIIKIQTNQREDTYRSYERQHRIQSPCVTFVCLVRIYYVQLVSDKYRTLHTTSFDCFDGLSTITYYDEPYWIIYVSSTRTD